MTQNIAQTYFDIHKQFPANLQKKDSQSALHDGKSVVDRFIFVKTLCEFYEDFQEGIILDASYTDSRPNADWDSSTPIVLALHDTPGSHQELKPLLNTFAKLGCRTIAPSFPGIIFYDEFIKKL